MYVPHVHGGHDIAWAQIYTQPMQLVNFIQRKSIKYDITRWVLAVLYLVGGVRRSRAVGVFSEWAIATLLSNSLNMKRFVFCAVVCLATGKRAASGTHTAPLG